MTQGNLWHQWSGSGCPENLRLPNAANRDASPYDIVIIGAGVVGTALAYKLSQIQLRILLIDKNNDIGEGTSKGNSAIIHTGFDATPGTLESSLVTAASQQWPALAEKLKVPLKRCGAIVLAIDDEQAKALPATYEKALANGVEDVELLDGDAARALEPHASNEIRGGLLVHRESIIDPFGVPLAYAEIALANGVDILLGAEVSAITCNDDTEKTVHCVAGTTFRANIVLNAAGLWSRDLTKDYEGELFDTNPRRGQFLLYDKACAPLAHRILLPMPTRKTKGMLVSPTIFGNILAGPTAEDLDPRARSAVDTTPDGLEQIRNSARKLCPDLLEHTPIAAYAGLRCNCTQGSFLLRFNDGMPGMVTVTGVRSTGLSASPALADHLVDGMTEHCGLVCEKDREAVDSRPESAWPGWWKHPYDDADRLADNPDYGRMVCYCEQISRGEIIDALNSPITPLTLDAVKR
ncbi:MAG: FAD-dependent oxidoreductase, partial [Candidatus Hydrogenedentes bacterium]|nr:FAD-dependent oxidoreductase [Candidatus Hydrogenedentota bacterium]